jgi:hypothetical protein
VPPCLVLLPIDGVHAAKEAHLLRAQPPAAVAVPSSGQPDALRSSARLSIADFQNNETKNRNVPASTISAPGEGCPAPPLFGRLPSKHPPSTSPPSRLRRYPTCFLNARRWGAFCKILVLKAATSLQHGLLVADDTGTRPVSLRPLLRAHALYFAALVHSTAPAMRFDGVIATRGGTPKVRFEEALI